MQLQRAQLSLEYLILLAAVLAVFSLLLPLLGQAYHASLFGLDSVNAKQFIQSLESTAQEMRFLADGSAKRIDASPITEWSVSCSGKNLGLTVKSSALQEEKRFSAQLPNGIQLQPSSFTEPTAFLIRKAGGRVLIEYR